MEVIVINNLYFIRRTKGNVIISIMYNRTDNKYHFVNLSSNHICTCGFDTVDDAIADMEQFKNDEIIIDYYKINT